MLQQLNKMIYSDMKKIGLLSLFCIVISISAQAQTVAIKTNLLYDVLTTPNLGVEVAVAKKFTIDLTGQYNPWDLPRNSSMKHYMAQAEGRYWIFEAFNGHFVGVHAQYLGGIEFSGLKLFPTFDQFVFDNDFTYKNGQGYGGGISYGYQMYLTPRLNICFTIGIGYNYFKYDKFKHAIFPGDNYYEKSESNENYLGIFENNYFGLTKAGVSIIYIIK